MTKKISSWTYLISLLVLAVLGIVLIELSARQWGGYGAPNNTYVNKVYTETRSNVVFGDSHVGHDDWLGTDFAFLGNGGMSLYEQLQAAKFYFRDKQPGKIIIETGPQLFSSVHDKSWRTLPAGSFPEGLPGLELHLIEPVLVQGITHRAATFITRELFTVGNAAAQANQTLREARDVARKLLEQSDHNFDSNRVPKWARQKLMEDLVINYRPKVGFNDRIAWNSLMEMIAFLTDKGADICLVRVPIANEFEKMMLSGNAAASNKLTRRMVRQTARNIGAPYIDYRDLKARFKLNEFRNQDHMNSRGAARYWEIAYQACFGDGNKYNVRLENAPLRDMTMQNRTADGGFDWWKEVMDQGVVITEDQNAIVRPLYEGRGSIKISSGESQGEWRLEKTISVKPNTLFVANIGGLIGPKAMQKGGEIGLRATYFDKGGNSIASEDRVYSFSDLIEAGTYPFSPEKDWNGLRLRGKTPQKTASMTLSIFGQLESGTSINLDDFYVMSSAPMKD